MPGIRTSFTNILARQRVSSPRQLMARVALIGRRGTQDARALARRVWINRAATGRRGVGSFRPAPANQIQNGILQRRLAERFQIKEAAPAPTLTPEITPVVVVDDMTKAERSDEILECADGFRIAPGAGNIINYGLVNLSASSILGLPRYVVFYNRDAANPCDVVGSFIDSVGLPASFIAEYIAKTVEGFPKCSVLARADLPAAISPGPSCFQITVPAFAGVTVDLDGYVIPPGKTLLMQTKDTNTSISMSIRWREKPVTR